MTVVATSGVTLCQSSVWGYAMIEHSPFCIEEIFIYAIPAALIVVFGLLRLRQISDYPVVLMPRSVVHSVRTSASLTIMLLLCIFLFLHALHHDASPMLITSNAITLVGWMFATVILYKEHARALTQTWVLRTWWVLQLLVATIKLHAFIRYQQIGGHQTLDFFLFIMMYTLMVLIALVAFIQRDNFPRYSPVSVVPEENEIGSMLPKQGRNREVFNWSNTHSCTPAEIYNPSSLSELVQVIKHANKNNMKLRVRGSGSSSSPIGCTSQCLMSLEKLNKVVEGDKRNSTVRVEAGVPLHSLNDILAEFGMAITCLSPDPSQTVGGAIATGAHGSSLKCGSMSDAIIALDIVMSNGEMCHISTVENAELLDGARVSLGTLGVIYSVTIQCERQFNLHLEEALEELDEVMISIEEYLQHNDHVELLWYPYTTTVLTRQLTRTEQPATEAAGGFMTWYNEVFIRQNVARWISSLGTLFPRMVPSLSAFFTRRLRCMNTSARSSEMFAAMNQRILGPYHEMEYAVALGDARAVLAEIRRYIDQSVTQGFFVNLPVHVRFAAMDRSYLSPSYGRQTCYIAVRCHISTQNYKAFFHGLEEVLQRFGGRPNCATLHFSDVSVLRNQFPEFDRFCAIRARMDPAGMFSSTYIDQILGDVDSHTDV